MKVVWIYINIKNFIEKVNYKWERTDSLTQVKYNEMIVSFNQPYKGVYKV